MHFQRPVSNMESRGAVVRDRQGLGAGGKDGRRNRKKEGGWGLKIWLWKFSRGSRKVKKRKDSVPIPAGEGVNGAVGTELRRSQQQNVKRDGVVAQSAPSCKAGTCKDGPVIFGSVSDQWAPGCLLQSFHSLPAHHLIETNYKHLDLHID